MGGERLRSARNGKLGIWQERDFAGYCEAQILDPSPSPLPAVLSNAVTDNQPAIRHRMIAFPEQYQWYKGKFGKGTERKSRPKACDFP